MKLYVWRSNACANYGPGTVAAIGESVDEARGRAFSALVDWAKEYRCWLFDLDGSIGDDEREEWERLLKTINADLEAEPQVMAALVVSGSE